ncbi:MAG: hypothetical protein A2268_11300 [Candidatus Raymondbacteria bacterium RifOxyA12_full_50_37]|uniref:Translocation and assembly module TamB C-terminal domain-containing protein n=1 Tax=Candidatus Raymondbacteria bacterium RIFOXYD12_FULL_49_13 TaxID=1817890 RepID=A0A1F7FAG6_UNCRA|nr:MAG: hypothetical protein A2268_11300 [Candidatus Raymondbacteria bacterium RifOxyA12_full_50_37]OGJ92359.1 MAG: hypothetical protein A2248_10425 [Candidatus Raymondbacteria bacterium RIFOXYA2_FULL_49_16]OGJ99340.1 MAG: hypothetical protein A2453_13485 [Candidatus Raymondbacteria bacterium RIFOXYC2_FULL_50_21]OGK03645.1 MAG: hypothetical protein A2519_02640 [Candidatus Raymondbacteria bacterium RIFOXYD12_FULL_49_13]OGP39832.1 MAG: hypothetical protein A2324_10515 [Candidatus Raymondbacteria 
MAYLNSLKRGRNIAIAVVLVLAGLWIGTRTAWFQQRLGSFLQKEISSAMNGTVTWDTLYLSPLMRVTITGIVIRTKDNEPVISANRVTLRIVIVYLLKRRIDVRNLTISGSKVVYDQGRHPNLTDAFSSPASEMSDTNRPAWTLNIRKFSADSVQCRYIDTAIRISADLENIRLHGRLVRTTEVFASLDCGKGKVRILDSLHPMDSLHCTVSTGSRRVTLDDICLRFYAHAVARGSLDIPYDSNRAWHAVIAASADDEFLSSLGSRKWGITRCETATLNFRMQGLFLRPALYAHCHAQGLVVEQMPFDMVDAILTRDTLGGTECALTAHGPSMAGTAGLTGRSLLDGPRADVSNYRINANLRYDFPGARAAMYLDGFASGLSLREFSPEAQCTARIIKTGPFDSATSSLALFFANIANNQIVVSGQGPNGLVLTGKGFIGRNRVDVHANFSIDDMLAVSRYLSGQGIAGRLSGSIALSNASGPFFATGLIRGSDITWQDLVADTLAVQVQYTPATGLEVVSAAAFAQGRIERTIAFIGLPRANGFARMSFSGKGSFSNPRARVDIVIDDFSCGTLVADTVTAVIVLQDRIISLKNIALVRDSSKVYGTATVDLTQGHRISAQCTLHVQDTCGPIAASGEFAFSPSWRLDSSIADPVRIRVLFNGVCLKPYGGLFSNAFSIDGRLDGDAGLIFRHGVWQPEGEMILSSGYFSSAALGATVRDIAMRLSPAQNIERGVRVSLTTGQVSYNGILFPGVLLNGAFTAKSFILDTVHVRTNHGGLSAKGEWPLVPFKNALQNPASHLIVFADSVPLAGCNPFLSGWRFVSGEVSGNVSIDPSRPSKRTSGELRAQNVIIALDEISPSIGPVHTTVAFNGDSVFLKECTGTWNKGTVKAWGLVHLSSKGIDNAEIKAEVRAVRMEYGADVRCRADSIFAVLGRTPDAWRIEGEAYLGPSEYFHEVLFNQVPTMPGTQAPPSKNAINLAATIHIPDSCTADIEIGKWITGAAILIHAHLGGTVKFGGTTDRPAYEGLLKSTEGTIMYLDNVFTITEGYLRLPGSQPHSPRLRESEAGGKAGRQSRPSVSLLASTGISQAQGETFQDSLTITLRVSGDLNDPVVKLTSAPIACSEPEIISLLTFGTLTPGATGESASEIIGKSVSGYVSRQAQKTLGLDQVRIQGNPVQGGTASLSNVTVSVSKRIGRHVTLTYRQALENHLTREGVLSWRILPYLFLDSETDAQGNTGLDLKLKVEK